ncbi:long-chain-fatty-acid--CoA ligase bubblegum-like [Ceratitis capitata]|uniref:long-chain-fatty-acid--CoA ligase bubblegum-like n=1 Tax=Ceratitis capitata TaxID=7213 RepID=UPI000A0FD3FA|nr:long-chain-fatty-acid--CoA ligase bubblegum-like [Ceratitis capitata]
MEQFERAESNSNFIWRLVTAWSRQTLLNSYLRNAEGIQPNPTIKYALAALIMRPYKAQLGLSRCKHYWVGGAPLSVQTKKFFLSMDIPISDMFGASEAGGAISLTSSYCHLNSTGRVLSGFEIKIDKPNKDGQGEICLRGRCIMMGYLNKAQRSRELIEPNGWLHTGDMGRLNDDGCLQLTGRIKELLITSGGENISPVYVENLIKAELRCVSNALLVGDKRKYLTVLLTLKTNMDNICGLPLDSLHTDTVSWLKALGFDYTYLSEVLKIPAFAVNFNYKGACPSLDQKVMLAIEKGLEKANQNALSHAQRVQKFALLPHDFTVATGELGPTLKARRSFICEKYVNVIEKLYCENS